MRLTYANSNRWGRGRLALAIVGQIMVAPRTALAHHAGSPPISCFAVTATGDDASLARTLGTLSGRGKNAREVLLRFGNAAEWSLGFLQDVGDGTVCFDIVPPPGNTSIRPDKDELAHVTHGFRGYGIDGVTENFYTLDMFGVFDDPAAFPPTQLDEPHGITLDWWELSSGAKGKEKKNFCRGEGEFLTHVDVEFLGIMDEDGSCPAP